MKPTKLPIATRESATHMIRSLKSKATNVERLLGMDAMTADELIEKAEVLCGLAILLEREARTTKIGQELLKRHGASVN